MPLNRTFKMVNFTLCKFLLSFFRKGNLRIKSEGLKEMGVLKSVQTALSLLSAADTLLATWVGGGARVGDS